MTDNPARFEIVRGKLPLRRWRVRLVNGGNNEVLSVSEHLNSRAAAEANVAAQREAIPTADVVYR